MNLSITKLSILKSDSIGAEITGKVCPNNTVLIIATPNQALKYLVNLRSLSRFGK